MDAEERKAYIREQREHAIESTGAGLKAAGVPEPERAKAMALLVDLFDLAEKHGLDVAMCLRLAGSYCEAHQHVPHIDTMRIEFDGFHEDKPPSLEETIREMTSIIDLPGLKEFLEQRTRENRSS